MILKQLPSSVLILFLLVVVLQIISNTTTKLLVDGYQYHIVLPGGTGLLGQAVISNLVSQSQQSQSQTQSLQLDDDDDDDDIKITILARNKYLASTPARVTKDFGWVGKYFLQKYSKSNNNNIDLQIRDWDGGDLLDIVGCDWIGWQDDIFSCNTDQSTITIIINLVGGYTEQRVMATERLVRESLSYSSNSNNNNVIYHVCVSPTESQLKLLSPGEQPLKLQRIQRCEDIVQKNCFNYKCVRLDGNKVDIEAQKLCNIIADIKQDSRKTQQTQTS